MELLRLLYLTLILIEDKMWRTDEEYQKMRNKKDDLEQELISGMTKKQRALFSEYREQRENLMKRELHGIFSHYTILILPRN